ncbi:hypothetical protein JRO89_XS07G0250500 [Xanthoceras sorbifolium]|uniref:Inositol oxygenase n=1 Tax=Xanthoceras sorbifolium TaxID=99658 RepID=A0ABQ8HUY0_9ROSI|nr:hypothetical protein JRO89_XS07G0250500 [Xanthoceras sorbifolium]
MKLAPHFFDPYEVLAKVGPVSYRLALLVELQIHNVFHISLLRKQLGSVMPASLVIPLVSDTSTILPQPEAVLDRRIIRKSTYRPKREILIKWNDALSLYKYALGILSHAESLDWVEFSYWSRAVAAVVGDTFPIGCAFDESIVHHKYFKENADYNNPAYNTKYGVYSEGCRLNNVMMSWGHDDYMYLMAKKNRTTLPSIALFIIRYHSFYSLHRSGAYKNLMNEKDVENLKWLQVFKCFLQVHSQMHFVLSGEAKLVNSGSSEA